MLVVLGLMYDGFVIPEPPRPVAYIVDGSHSLWKLNNERRYLEILSIFSRCHYCWNQRSLSPRLREERIKFVQFLVQSCSIICERSAVAQCRLQSRSYMLYKIEIDVSLESQLARIPQGAPSSSYKAKGVKEEDVRAALFKRLLYKGRPLHSRLSLF